jgi:arsenite methyltransferase
MLYPLSYERRRCIVYGIARGVCAIVDVLDGCGARCRGSTQLRQSLRRHRRCHRTPFRPTTSYLTQSVAVFVAVGPDVSNNGGVTDQTDRWHRWLMDTRFGGDASYRERDLAEFLYPVRDAVLDRAELVPGQTLLDVGAGDGLIGFGAVDRLGADGHVIFSDISQDLLDHCRAVASAEDVLDRCDFVLASADHLDGIPDAQVDVVTTRSVLIYVKNKLSAFKEFYRVLRPQGRISLFEPINVLMSQPDPNQFFGYDVTAVSDLAEKVRAVYTAIQPLGDDPMLDFDERDLVRLAWEAGFPDVRLDLEVTVRARKTPAPWDRFVRSSGNPLIPTFGQAMQEALTPGEASTLVDHLKPLVETGTGVDRMALAYLTAEKS